MPDDQPQAAAAPPSGTESFGEHQLDRLFRTARTRNSWLDRPLGEDQLRALYGLAKWGPTTANSNPARFVFLRSEEAKQRLKPHLSSGNVDKTMSAPCCVIIAYDTRFHELMPKLFPSRNMGKMFEDDDSLAQETAFRASTLQGGYLIMAARALGLDAGPMSGFNPAGVDAEFFPDGRWKSNFLCNIGYGGEEGLFPRNPRLDFDEACRIL